MPSDQELWSDAAEQYHKFVGSTQDKLRIELLYPTIFATLGNIKAKSLLDIGCGNGFFALEAAQRGAHVSAFDSKAMIDIAKSHFSHPQIAFTSHDASKSFPYQAEQFDYITANMVLMDMANIDMLLEESHRVLKASGKAIFSILHPCFTPPVGRFRRGILGRLNEKHAYFHLKSYFGHTPTPKSIFGLQGVETMYYPRTISEYAHAFKKHNLTIADILEPQASGLIILKRRSSRAQRIAIFLIFVLEKT